LPQPKDQGLQAAQGATVAGFERGRGDEMTTNEGESDSKKTNDALSRIEWMLSRKATIPAEQVGATARSVPPHGDLTDLNSSRLILNSVGSSLLADIVSDFLDLLETSAAVYEKNGDHALVISSSNWCRFLGEASRQRCRTPDNREALASGQWHCHESCWNESSRRTVETGEPADVECRGGIRLFAVPVRAGEEIIGSISFGYGDPPRDSARLQELADAYGVSVEELRERGQSYETRPTFVVELAKKRLVSAARLIGEIVERKRAEEALRRSQARLVSIFLAAPAGIGVVVNRVLAEANDRLCEMTGFSREELIGRSARVLYPTQEDFEFVGREKYRQIAAQGTGTVETRWMRKDGALLHVLLSSTPIEPSELSAGVTFTAVDITERKRAEQELRTSEENFRRITENMHDLVCETDAQGRFRYITPSCRRVVGYDPEDLLGQSVFALIHPDDRARAMVEFQEGVRARAEREVEYRYQHADGRYVWLRSTGSFLFDGSGEFFGAVISSRDVTERKQAEAALAESEQRFSVFMEHLPAAAFIKNYDGLTLFANRYLKDVFGWQEATGKTTAELLPPETAERMIADDRRVLTEGPTFIQEIITDIRGDTRSFDTYKFPIAVEGSATLLGGIAVDVTERELAEKSLREKTEELDRFFNLTLDLLCIADMDGYFRRLNVAWEKVLGYGLEELMAKPFLEFVHPDDVASTLEAVTTLTSQLEVINFVNRFRCKDGSYRWIEWRSAPSGNRIYAAARDVTDRIRAEEERSKLEAQMREVQKLESLGVLAGGIAHDFNNILMAILGNADLALLNLSPASPVRQNLEEITRASQRAADLCRQMLAYSGKGRFVVGRYDLSEIVREMAQMLEVSVTKKASLRYSFARELPPVEVDVTQLRQIIMNLITNASEALGDDSGVISIATGVMACDRAYLAESYLDDNLPEGNYVYLEVSDTGLGMDAETRSRIFDPFFTTKFIGRGLGLAAVLGIVRGHMGAIKVYSEPGQGTTIKVLLPAADWKLGDRVQVEERSALPRTGGTILLVDDDPYVRDVGSQMLTWLGYQVVTAAHGREGVEIFQTQGSDIDCVILDLTMPEMGGEEAFRELRRLRSDVRVIMSSGYNEQDVTQRFVGKGLAGFVQKPYTVAKLREALKKVCDR
jgi:PAS domain S-box-containing protein